MLILMGFFIFVHGIFRAERDMTNHHASYAEVAQAMNSIVMNL